MLAYHFHYNEVQPDTAVLYYSKAQENFKVIGDNYEVAYLEEYKGEAYLTAGLNRQAYIFFENAVPLYYAIGKFSDVADMYNNLAAIESDSGDLLKAMSLYKIATKAYTADSNWVDVAKIKMNMGAALEKSGDLEGAMELYQESLSERRANDDLYGMGYVYSNIGSVLKLQGDYEQALIYLDSSFAIRDSFGYAKEVANCHISYAGLYFRWGKYDTAEEHYKAALEILEEVNSPEDMVTIYINLGMMSGIAGDIKKAEKYLSLSLESSENMGLVDAQVASHDGLSQVYEELNDYKKALYHFKRTTFLSDSLSNKSKIRELSRLTTELKFENKIREDSLKNAVVEADLEKAELEQVATSRQNRLILLVSLIGALSLLIIIWLQAKSNKRKKRDNEIIREQKAEVEEQRNEIELQKETLEEKNQEILDSIQYAKRLQNAILPQDEFIQTIFPDSFMLFIPKDIVSGDFYWCEKIDDQIFFAVADCTGHGVPGAMVSVVCSNALNKAVIEEHIKDSGKILDRVTELVIDRFKKSDEEVYDGMDIALCSINAKDRSKLYYAGANNPCWIYRKESKAIEVIKPNKQPIGKYAKQEPFDTQEIQLNSGDNLYIFSDGYADQFGGPKGKKFKYSSLRQLLEKISDKPGPIQSMVLLETITEWRGELEQIDDICIMGVKF